MKRLTFLSFLSILVSYQLVSATLVEIGPCECGIFHLQDLSTPLFVQSVNYNMCNPFFRQMCNELCISLNIGSVDVDVTAICDSIGDGVDVYLKIMSRMCSQIWKDTNLSPTDPICCESGIDVACEESK